MSKYELNFGSLFGIVWNCLEVNFGKLVKLFDGKLVKLYGNFIWN